MFYNISNDIDSIKFELDLNRYITSIYMEEFE